MGAPVWAEAYGRFMAWLTTHETHWFICPPEGVLYCDDEAEAESWYSPPTEGEQ